MRITESELNQLTGKASPRSVSHVMHEAGEQQALFDIVARHLDKIPALRNLTAIPMGEKRDGRTAKQLQMQGVRPGYPDILMDVARGGYHGLRIEMKTTGNKPTPLQREWHENLTREGYAVIVCYDATDAWDAIMRYLGLEGEK